MDQWVLHSFYAVRTIKNTLIVIGISELGSVMVVLGISAVAVLLFVRKHQYINAITLMTAVGATAAIVILLKNIIHRERPSAFFQAYLEKGYSFPSWHAAGSAALYLSLAYLIAQRVPGNRRWLAYTLGTTLTLVVGFTRLYLGVHYATDVVAGWIIGAGCAYLSIKYIPRVVEIQSVKKYLG